MLSRLMTEEQGLVAEAAKMRRQAIAEARESGKSLEEIGRRLGVDPRVLRDLGRQTAGWRRPSVGRGHWEKYVRLALPPELHSEHESAPAD